MNNNDLGNFIHNCSMNKVKITKYKKTLFDLYNSDEIKEIYSFYLTDWTAKEKEGCKSFYEYGWKGMDKSKGLNRLEGLLLEEAGIQVFCMKKTSTIKETLEKMNLNDEICIYHPRAVMMIESKMNFSEDFIFKIVVNETRMECLFRHIRNSLAHNLTYVFENGNVLLEDKNSEGNCITARILLREDTLLSWIKIVTKNK